MAWRRSEPSCAPSSVKRIWNSGWRARSTRKSSHSPRWPPRPRRSLQSTSPSSHARRSAGARRLKPEKKANQTLLVVGSSSHVWFCFSFAGEPGLVHQGSHQGQPAECDALLLRPGAAANIRADGEGLISPLPALRTLLGLGQPKKAQLHLDLDVVLRGGGRDGETGGGLGKGGWRVDVGA